MYTLLRSYCILRSRLLLDYTLHSLYWVSKIVEELQFDERHAYNLGAGLANERLIGHEVSVEFTCYYANTNLLYSPGLNSSSIDCAMEPCMIASETTGAFCVVRQDSTTASM